MKNKRVIAKAVVSKIKKQVPDSAEAKLMFAVFATAVSDLFKKNQKKSGCHLGPDNFSGVWVTLTVSDTAPFAWETTPASLLKIELAKITGVAPEDVSMSDDNGDKEKLEEDRKTQLEKIEGLEKSLQLQSEANKRLNEKCEVSKKKNKVLTQDNETQLKEIAGLQTKLHQAVESKESSERKLKIEQSALAGERKSAKDTKASLQAMEETHKAQRKMELAETAAREQGERFGAERRPYEVKEGDHGSADLLALMLRRNEHWTLNTVQYPVYPVALQYPVQ